MAFFILFNCFLKANHITYEEQQTGRVSKHTKAASRRGEKHMVPADVAATIPLNLENTWEKCTLFSIYIPIIILIFRLTYERRLISVKIELEICIEINKKII